MNDADENTPPPVPYARVRSSKLPQLPPFSMGCAAILLLVLFLPAFIWFGCRIEPGPDQIAVVIRKTGRNLPSGQIVALKPEQKGIQLEVLSEGRYFRNPYTWGWEIHKITDIPAGKLGVMTRVYGNDLPPGSIIAAEGTKGIVGDILRPGKHRVNPYAYAVNTFDAITIRPGHVGVVTALTGEDVLDGKMPAEKRNTFLVEKGLKGVQPEVLDPGTYYVNPYLVNIVEVNLQSQRFEMSGEDIISFLTLDGFTVTVEGTIEFAMARDKAAILSHRVGDMDDVVKKVIMPRARGFSRIEGSKHPAIDFIVGENRQKFQSDLDEHLRLKCVDWGVDVKSVLVRRIVVPDQIASISRDRQVAVQDANKYEQQIEQARSKAELARQEALAVQNKEKVEADTIRIRALIAAEQEQAVRVIAATQELAVARIDKQAAEFKAKAVRLKAEGERDAIKARNEAEAAVVAGKVKAFDNGMNLSRYTFYQKIGPQIQTILTSDEEEGLGSLFIPYMRGGKEVSK